MIQNWILLYDAHIDECITPEYKLVKKFIKDRKPYGIGLGGDFMHLSSLSHWNKNKRKTAEKKRYKKECDIANKELDYLQKYCKKMFYCEGNHEDWVEQYIEEHPESEGIFNLSIMLKLDKRGIEWVRLNKLRKLGSLYVTHGMFTNQYHSKKHLEKLGCNVAYGHVHQNQSHQQNQKMQEAYMAWSIPCLCNHEPDYLKGRHANWMDGFADVWLDTKTGAFNLYPINIINGSFIYNGKVYKI